jgi:release factor glutamine methyltransferase
MILTKNKSLFSIIHSVRQFLSDADISSAQLESFMIISYFCNLSREEIILRSREIYLDQKDIDKINIALQRRIKGEPISYIIGKREFYSLDFKVNSDVLDPRPDSEILIEEIIKLIPNFDNSIEILELGVGSGCLILTILNNISNATGIAIDINPKSIAIAKENAKNLNLEDRINFIHSDWFSNLSSQKFDIIISNPPYIKKNDIANLQKEVKDSEPIIALDGGDDGLDCYRKIADDISNFLKDNAFLILEIGQNMEDDIIDIFKENGLKFIKYAKDLNAIIRCLIFTKQ